MQLNDGHKLQNGKYRIEKKIGQGGFGITYLARCYEKIQGAMGSASSYYMIVIKEFFWSRYCSRDTDGYSVSISSTEGKILMAQFKQKLKKEGEIISKLSHPNIVGILDIFEENNTAYLVMQYVEGESLGELIRKKGKINETVALQYTEQICSALKEIHNKRILHLDIKPSNILIDEDNRVKLIDFGISKQYDETEQETSNTPIGISPGYSPIEQYGALKSFLPPTDIYSTGATLYKMLTGQTPLAATARSESDLESVRFFNPDVSKQTAAAVAKAMNEKIRDRFQTVQEFLQALKNTDSGEDTDEEMPVNTPPERIEEIMPDDTKIDKQPEKVEIPKPPAPPKIPPKIEKPPVIVPERPVYQDRKDRIPEKPEILNPSGEPAYLMAKADKPKIPKVPKIPEMLKVLKIPEIMNRNFSGLWKKFLVPAAVIVILTVIVFVFISRNSGSRMPKDTTKNVSTTAIEEAKTNEFSTISSAARSTGIEETKTNEFSTTSSAAARPTGTSTDVTKEQKEREEERLRKEREDRLNKEREEERLRKEREDRLNKEREEERLRKEREDRLNKEREEERLRLEKEAQAKRIAEAATLLLQANNTFNNSSLGFARYEESFKLYKRSKDLGGNVAVGYNNFLSKAKSLVESGSGFDVNVKILLQYAQQLSNTQEVRDLLAKCN